LVPEDDLFIYTVTTRALAAMVKLLASLPGISLLTIELVLQK